MRSSHARPRPPGPWRCSSNLATPHRKNLNAVTVRQNIQEELSISVSHSHYILHMFIYLINIWQWDFIWKKYCFTSFDSHLPSQYKFSFMQLSQKENFQRHLMEQFTHIWDYILYYSPCDYIQYVEISKESLHMEEKSVQGDHKVSFLSELFLRQLLGTDYKWNPLYLIVIFILKVGSLTERLSGKLCLKIHNYSKEYSGLSWSNVNGHHL